MPLNIVKNDITKMKCDAIVNAANSSLLGGGGVDGAIHRAAGRKLLEECMTLGGCATGDAKMTGAYDLPCKYVIHTVGPIWRGGNNDEENLLRSCYKKSFALAKQAGLESIAFPLISAGVYGYPKKQAFSIAVDEAKRFLEDDEMTVYIVVFDRDDSDRFLPDQSKVADYIDENYIDLGSLRKSACYEGSRKLKKTCETFNDLTEDEYETGLCFNKAPVFYAPAPAPAEKKSHDKIPINLKDGFAVTLLKLIDKKGVSDVECYKKANVSRQTWYKIMNDGRYKPSKNTILAFAIALKLDLDETNDLLATEGFVLSRSKKSDVIIEYYIRNGIYDIYEINETLFYFDQPCLGV